MKIEVTIILAKIIVIHNIIPVIIKICLKPKMALKHSNHFTLHFVKKQIFLYFYTGRIFF